MARTNSLFTTDVAALSLVTLRSNSRLNLVARTLLMLFSLVTAALAVIYVVVRAQAIVEILLKPSVNGDEIGARLLALGAPVLLLGGFAVLGAIAGALLHSRSLDESVRNGWESFSCQKCPIAKNVGDEPEVRRFATQRRGDRYNV